ncbi:hypothetical protein [Enterococcus casseliflavus]|uniref:hypothetical protein n=1 Tax=Enterococcus casseliflavus TaxID=37734 RepID=UPI0039A60753
MTTENVRIAVRDAHDSETLTYMDNSAVGAIHFDKADLTRFFEGDTTALVMRINNKHPEASFVTVGNKLSFVYKNRDYWLNISQTGRDGYYKELVAFSLTWELYKEKMPAYTSPKAMTIAEIIKVIDSEGTLEIGINEMPDKKMVFSWDGIQNKKDRLYSAANQIGAELGLVTETNDDYSLKRHVINIYKEHTDTHQGLGQDKRDTTLRVGKELKVINQKDSADEFYTAIRATGKDGLSIVNLEFEERDDDGNILYFSKKGDNGIRALQARNKIPSNTNKKDDGYLFDDRGETEYTTVEALKGYMLSELKKISQIKVDYETQGYFDSDPGDTFSLEDSVYYNPPLYLEARVYEQTESLVLGVTSSDRTTFTNFVQKESEISNDLLARMRKLIEANKVFTYEIITSDGVTFKNGFGSTTLTARVRDGIKDVTDTFSLKWYKDGTLFSNTKTVTINAADIEEKAVFRFEVADDSGNVRGGAEVTVTNIDDGKKGEPGEIYYPHRGYLMADGTFTKVYPNENLIDARVVLPSSNNANLYPITNEARSDNGKQFSRTRRTNPTQYPTTFSIFTSIDVRAIAPSLTGKRIGLSNYVRGSTAVNMSLMARYVGNSESGTFPNESVGVKIGTSWQKVNFIVESFPADVSTIRFNPLQIATPVPDLSQFFLDMRDWKIEILEDDQEPTYFTTPPSVDYENAYPKYEGFYSDTNQVGSDNPDDYKPWTPFMGPQGGQGPKGDSAPLISLSGATQAITVDKDGKITPASSFAVTGTAVNTAISNWTYSLNGGNFGSAVPTGVTRSGNTVTIDPTKAVFDTFTIKAADATVSDVFTISRIKDGGEGPPGADAYTVFLTNESYTFAGSTTAALAGSTTTEVIVYKGITKITPTSITVGTKPTGLSSSVSGSIITLTATTALVSKSGTVPITITADGKTFTKQFSYALSLQGATGNPGKGVTAEEISYAISQDGTTPPTSGWSGTRPTPKAGWYMWTRTRFKYTDNTYSAYFYLVAQQGKDAIIISATPPTNPTKEDLWQDPNDATSTVYKWDGTKWIHWGISIDNLIASNVQIENGVFKRVEGALIVGSEFSNPYTRRYDDGTIKIGELTIKDAETRNAGVIRNSSGVIIQSYEQVISDQFIHMSRYEGNSIGDQTKLIASASMTFDLIQLNNREAGFAGSLSAEMLYDTGWLKVTRLKGTAGDIYLKRYMNRILIRFDQFVWNGSANGASTSNAVAILPDKVREGFPQMFTVPVWIEGNATEKFQVENGRLYKLSNNSGNSRITAVGEVYI